MSSNRKLEDGSQSNLKSEKYLEEDHTSLEETELNSNPELTEAIYTAGIVAATCTGIGVVLSFYYGDEFLS